MSKREWTLLPHRPVRAGFGPASEGHERWASVASEVRVTVAGQRGNTQRVLPGAGDSL